MTPILVTTLVVLAVVFVLVQTMALWLLWKFVMTFGTFMEPFIEAYRTMLRVQQRQEELVKELRDLRFKESA